MELDPQLNAWIYTMYWKAQEPAGGPVHLLRHHDRELMDDVHQFVTLGGEQLSLKILLGEAAALPVEYCEVCLHDAKIIFAGHRAPAWRPNPDLL